LAGLKPGRGATGLRAECQVSPTRAALTFFMPVMT
jgi:hypothetical protein